MLRLLTILMCFQSRTIGHDYCSLEDLQPPLLKVVQGMAAIQKYKSEAYLEKLRQRHTVTHNAAKLKHDLCIRILKVK